MSAPQESREKVAARISEMASEIYGVPQDEFGLGTADECARMLRILSGIEVKTTDEPFLPLIDKAASDEDSK